MNPTWSGAGWLAESFSAFWHGNRTAAPSEVDSEQKRLASEEAME